MGFKQWVARQMPRYYRPDFTLSETDLNDHVFVCGSTGSGKTTTMNMLLLKFIPKRVHVLILEPSSDQYRRLKREPEYNDLKVYPLGTEENTLRINPFFVPYGVDLNTHKEHLVEIFSAQGTHGELPGVLTRCIDRIYTNRGWRGFDRKHLGLTSQEKWNQPESKYYFPILDDFLSEVDILLADGSYSKEFQGDIRQAFDSRFRGLSENPKASLFNTYEHCSMEELLGSNVLLEAKGYGADNRALVIRLLLTLIKEQLGVRNKQSSNSNMPLSNVIVIEEAHNVVGKKESTNTTDPAATRHQKDLVSLVDSALTEWRKNGVGMIIVDQSPSAVSSTVLKQTNTKITHCLRDPEDKKAIIDSFYWARKKSESRNTDNYERILHTLPKGKFLVCKGSNFACDYTVSDAFTHVSRNTVTDQELVSVSELQKEQFIRCIEYISSHGKNKAQQVEKAKSLLFSIGIYDACLIGELVPKLHFYFKKSTIDIAEFEVTDKILNRYIVHVLCEMMGRNKMLFPRDFIDNLNQWLEGDSSAIEAIKTSLAEKGYDQQWALNAIRTSILSKSKDVLSLQLVVRELEQYLFQVESKPFSEIAHQILSRT